MILAWLAGCSEQPIGQGDSGTDTAPPVPDCFAEGDPRLQVALESGSFEETAEGMDAPVSIPPQGGAPYTPWQVRVTGAGALNSGIRMVATASEGGTALGDITIDLTPICANVPPNDGWWMLTGVHVRYWDYTVDELIGRSVDVHFSLQDVGGGPELGGADLAVELVASDEPPAL